MYWNKWTFKVNETKKFNGKVNNVVILNKSYYCFIVWVKIHLIQGNSKGCNQGDGQSYSHFKAQWGAVSFQYHSSDCWQFLGLHSVWPETVYYHVTLFIGWLTIWQLVFPEKRQKQKSQSFYKLFLEMIFYYITIFYLLEENPYSYSHTDLHEYHGTEIFGSHLQVCPLHNPNIYQR